MNDVDLPMGNAELRLRLQNIETISNETHIQAKKTNGRVNWMEKVIWTAMGALPLLTVWSGWLTLDMLNQPQTVTPDQLQAAVEAGINSASNKAK